jgi:hypothetical protein
MEDSEQVIRFLITVSAVMTVISFATWLQRATASTRNGWFYLTPGPMVWIAAVLGVTATGFFTYIYLFVGSIRPDAENQMQVLFVLTVSFNLLTVVAAYFVVAEEVRWNATKLQRRTMFFRWRSMSWYELAEFGVEPTGYYWVSGYDRMRIRFSPYQNGFDQLMRKVVDHLPTDLPPAEAQLAQTALVAATR